MFGTALLIGLVALIVLMVLNIIISKASSYSKYTIYIPAIIVFAIGLILIFISVTQNIVVSGLGLGGWGIAFLFAAAVTAIATSIVDSGQHS
ncbi:hypothetical protein [Virgibacillus ihumii]|uniref:hypothetical protein n=1 Tax=Virgibacillus ihumii TaxID=2686091 RepID=UPI00157CB533|nr:hypothetical protein [Virgibacillus ihumii]